MPLCGEALIEGSIGGIANPTAGLLPAGPSMAANAMHCSMCCAVSGDNLWRSRAWTQAHVLC
eukprot:5986507-Lingulodinium_polyedra.AAC.1